MGGGRFPVIMTFIQEWEYSHKSRLMRLSMACSRISPSLLKLYSDTALSCVVHVGEMGVNAIEGVRSDLDSVVSHCIYKVQHHISRVLC